MRNICILITAAAVALCVGAVQAEEIFHYSFDSDYTDSSGNGFHATPTSGNDDTDTDGVSITSESVFGGGAANFTSERDYVSIPHQVIYAENEFSLSFWARDLSSSTTGSMVIGEVDDYPGWFFIWFYQGTAYWRGSGNSGVAMYNATLGPVATDDAWHHYAFIVEDADNDSSIDDINFYEDSNLVGTSVDKRTGFFFEAIGEAYGDNLNFDFEGQIDEFWLFDHALTAAEVSSLHSSNTVPEPTTLGLLLCGLLTLAGLRRGGRKS